MGWAGMGPPAAPVCLQETSLGRGGQQLPVVQVLLFAPRRLIHPGAHSSSCQPDRLQKLVAGGSPQSPLLCTNIGVSMLSTLLGLHSLCSGLVFSRPPAVGTVRSGLEVKGAGMPGRSSDVRSSGTVRTRRTAAAGQRLAAWRSAVDWGILLLAANSPSHQWPCARG
jgi:hypothetical protein